MQTSETGNYLSVGRNGPVKSHHPLICLKDKIGGMENEVREIETERQRWRRRERSSLELRSEFGSGGSANQVYLISEFRMQSRQSSKRKRDEQQYKINPLPVFVNSASNDTVIYVEAKRGQSTSLPLAL